MTTIVKQRWIKTCSILATLATLLLTIELLMQTRGASLCKTSACDIIGDYTRFGETTILAGGILFFLFLATGMFMSQRAAESGWLSVVIALILVGSMAFEGVLVGFQLFSLHSVCLICAGTLVTLFLLLTLWSLAVADRKILFMGVVACISGIIGMYLLNPDPGLSQKEIALAPVFQQVGFTDPTIQKRRLTLISSMTCRHCQTVIQQMALHQEAVAEDLLAFAFIGVDEKSLHKAGFFAANAEGVENPLRLLSTLKTGQVDNRRDLTLPDKTMVETVRQKNLRTSQFLQLMGLTGVPVLIAEEDAAHRRILVGSEAILHYLMIDMPEGG